MKAFIIIDVQNDFCPGGALAVKEGDQVVPVINRLQKAFDLIVATQDWHPPDHLSFASNQNRKPGDVVLLNGIPQVLWPDHCVQGTWGAEFVPSLQRERIARIFQKGTDREVDSYSGFFDNNHTTSTGLVDYLKEKGVAEVSLAGLATDYCVKYTALDAVKLGFKTTLFVDACRGVDLQEGDVERAIEEMKNAGVHMAHSKDLLR